MKKYEFDALIQKHDSIDAAFIEFPYDVLEEFGTKGQVKVKAVFDGYEYRGSLARMGLPRHCLGLTQKVRQAIGKRPGDAVHVVLIQDVEERSVDLSADLVLLLAQDPRSKNMFESLSYSNKNEYVQWIVSAKREVTRKERLGKVIDILAKGTKRP